MSNNLRSSSLSSSEFAKLLILLLKRRNMPSLPSYGMGPQVIIPFSDFIRYGNSLLVTVLT